MLRRTPTPGRKKAAPKPRKKREERTEAESCAATGRRPERERRPKVRDDSHASKNNARILSLANFRGRPAPGKTLARPLLRAGIPNAAGRAKRPVPLIAARVSICRRNSTTPPAVSAARGGIRRPRTCAGGLPARGGGRIFDRPAAGASPLFALRISLDGKTAQTAHRAGANVQLGVSLISGARILIDVCFRFLRGTVALGSRVFVYASGRVFDRAQLFLIRSD